MSLGLSLYLDLLRFGLAVLVWVGHSTSHVFTGHPFARWFTYAYAHPDRVDKEGRPAAWGVRFTHTHDLVRNRQLTHREPGSETTLSGARDPLNLIAATIKA